MVCVDYQGFKSWSVGQNYTASSIDNFYAVLYSNIVVQITEDPEIIKLERTP